MVTPFCFANPSMTALSAVAATATLSFLPEIRHKEPNSGLALTQAEVTDF
jgi:hypothetical protein